jgi:hypothetical protein
MQISSSNDAQNVDSNLKFKAPRNIKFYLRRVGHYHYKFGLAFCDTLSFEILSTFLVDSKSQIW